MRVPSQREVIRGATLLLAVALAGCVPRRRDALIPNLERIADSLTAATRRGPGTSGRINALLGSEWRGVSVLDARLIHNGTAPGLSKDATKTFRALIGTDSTGAILVFRFYHGATQAVFVPERHARMAPLLFGEAFSVYDRFTLDSAGRFVIRR